MPGAEVIEGRSSASACALIALVSQIAGCAAAPRSAGAESNRADTVPAKNGIEAPARAHELPSNRANAETCAIGWMQIPAGVCVRFSELEQSDDLRSDLVAMDLLSKTGYVHLNLRIAVYRGEQKWCAFPAVLSLYQIEPGHQYAFRVPCSKSGTPIESGEPRLVVEVDEAIEMPRRK